MHIVNHLEIRDGTAHIIGRNVKAKMVARLHLWENASIEAVMEQYNLSAAEVYSTIAYYYDHQTTLDAEYDQNMATVKRVGTSFSEFKEKIATRQNSNE